MNPPDVRTCSLTELHEFAQQWAKAEVASRQTE